MSAFFEADGAKLIQADALEALAAMEDCSVDAVVTDPPYGLEFMGKGWDAPWKTDRRQTFDGTLSDDRDTPFSRSKVRNGNGASYGAASEVMRALQDWHYAWASECLRVLKPGGYLLAFGGARTYHRLACAVEDAGFEIRDQIMWVYGCLDEQTELVSESGVKPHHKAAVGERVLCYDPQNGEYSYQPILEIVEYDYSDTAYRLIGDFGEQVVSRNHRCIVECSRREAFQLAETLEPEARVPVLESLSELQQAFSDFQPHPSGKKQVVQFEVRQCANRESERCADSHREAQRENGSLCSLRDRKVDASFMAEEGRKADMQPQVQRHSQGRGMEDARAQRQKALETGVGVCVEDSDDGRNQSSLEGRFYLSETKRSLRRPKHQVCALPRTVHPDGAERRLRDGTPHFGSASDWESAYAERVGSSQESRRDEKQFEQPDAFCDERGPQSLRAWCGHKTALVRVVPFHYTGKMWCLRVPTGAFVAYRNGVAFPTGNSGFPKSLDVAKAIDKAARGVPQGASDPTSPNHGKYKSGCSEENPSGRGFGAGPGQFMKDSRSKYDGANRKPAPSTSNGFGYVTKGGIQEPEPLSEAARQWSGWGTALKPSHEPIVVARKPLEGTVAANVQKWGTGAINIDGCRIETDGRPLREGDYKSTENNTYAGRIDGSLAGGSKAVGETTLGRWPANLLHDGSEEVLSCFPDAPGQLAEISSDAPSDRTKNCFGKMNREGEASAQKRYTEEGSTNFAALPGQRRFDSGSAARFFLACSLEDSEWLCQKLNLNLANIADGSLSLPSLAGAIAQSIAATLVLPAGTALSVQSAPSMTVTLKESRMIAENAIEAILNIGPKLLCEWQQERLSLNSGPVSVVASRERTGIMKITVSHWKSDGSAVPVTFVITPLNSGRGEAASRIKYCAKADSMDREEGMDGAIKNDHPTVKPVALMRYLCRLVTPPGGLILDPFAGSGTTLVAARREGFRSIGIERDKHYCEIGKARMSQGMLLFGAEEEF